MRKDKTSPILWWRRLIQTLFLLIFLFLFLQTAFHPDNVTGVPLTLFFDLDPLVMLTVWIGGHAVVSALLLSFITLGVTLLFGRWFCGWICPFGTIHHYFTSRKQSKNKEKIKTGSYSIRQKIKYYLLVIILVAAFVGPNPAGWLDPFSFLYRSLATAVFPAINAGLQSLFGWTYEVNPVGLSAVTEPVYKVLRKYFLTLEQPHYYWSMLFGALFGIVIALNFFRNRFWCRYICPLGALLGIFGKNPTIRLNVDPDKCNNCMTCVMACQGGADPHSNESWKPSECLFCWNCHSKCPTNAISFQFKVPGGKKS